MGLLDQLRAGMSWSWLISVGLIGLVVLLVQRSAGPRRAIGAGVFLSLLVPEWVRWEISGDVFMNTRVAVSALALLLYLRHPLATYNFRLNICDYAVLAMTATHVLSDIVNSGPQAGILLRAYGEWILPYLAGRVAIQEVGDARWLLPLSAVVAGVLITFGVIEMFLPDRNLFEYLVNQQRPYDQRAPYNMFRLGLQRAYGTTNHPMYWGVLMFLLYPWMCYASARAARGHGPWWWRAMPYACVLGVFSSISRSPLLAVPIAFLAMQLTLYPARRIPWIVAILVLGVSLFFTWDKVYYGLETIAREAKSDKQVLIHGKEYRYTGTSHRALLLVAYAPAVQRTGLLGYGTEKCSSFPPNVPGIANIPVELIAVDNAFLLYLLRFGYCGVFAFLAIGGTAIVTFLRLTWRPKTEGQLWLAAMAATCIAMVFVLSTVWMPFEFGFFFLFCVGVAGGLWAEQEQPLVQQKELEYRLSAAPNPSEEHERRHRRRRRTHAEHDPNEDDLNAEADADADVETSQRERGSSRQRPAPPAETPSEHPAASPPLPQPTSPEQPLPPREEHKHGSGRRARERRSRE